METGRAVDGAGKMRSHDPLMHDRDSTLLDLG
jgi:hypothetical protein